MSLGLGLGLGLSRVRGGGSPDMILVYEIPAPSTDIQLAIQANSTWFSAEQSVVIDWGDSSAVTVSATSGQSGYIGHTYTAVGTYTIKISGSMKMYGRSNVNELNGQALLTRVDSFGKLGITSFWRAFRNCTGLMSVPKTLPSGVTNISNMFFGCNGAGFNPDVTNWDVSEVTDMHYLFYGCSGDAFNPDVSNWDVSNVTDMRHMFYDCSGDAFNPNMESWTLKTDLRTGSMLYVAKTQSAEWLDELLVAWAANPEQGDNITIDFSPNSFTEVEGSPLPAVASALAYLTTTKGWSIATANPYPAT